MEQQIIIELRPHAVVTILIPWQKSSNRWGSKIENVAMILHALYLSIQDLEDTKNIQLQRKIFFPNKM